MSTRKLYLTINTFRRILNEPVLRRHTEDSSTKYSKAIQAKQTHAPINAHYFPR